MNTHKHLRRAWRGISTATLLVLGAVAAQAHPGHSLTEATPAHLFTSADHLLVLAVSGLLLICGARLVQRTWPRRILQGTGVLALAGAAVVWGSQLI